jgi:uracil-DNA glycosylase
MCATDAITEREAAASLIRWWRDAGVDTLVEDEPRDWLARRDPPKTPVVQAIETVASSLAPVEMALPPALGELLAWMRASADVPEARWGSRRILPAGNPKSDLMILTDMPEPGNAEADTLMTGELGVLFDKMLAAIGRDRSSIWLAPFATVRPVGGRVAPDALKRLTEIARHHIGLVVPKRLLIMGDAPSRALLGTEAIAARGQTRPLNLGHATVETVATFHPRLLLERPAYKAQAWKDLQLLVKGL